jgi:hypothetical protein
MIQQPTTQNDGSANLKLKSELDDELLHLRQRRPALTGEIAAATTAAERANAALATGGTQHVDAAAAANARVTALRGALSSLEDQITVKEGELAKAIASERRESALAAMVPMVDRAAEAVRIYEAHAEEVNRVLIEHVPAMAAAFRKWEMARKEFVDAMRQLIPGVVPFISGDLYGKPVTRPEASAAAELLVRDLEERCADVRPVLAPISAQELCVDLKKFQIKLPEPYGAVSHSLAQTAVAIKKKAEKQR